jgi:small subunit ribosomal protein S20
VRSGLKTAIKAARTATTDGSPESVTPSLRQAERTIRKAASKGVISKKQASRRISRLAKRANAVQA